MIVNIILRRTSATNCARLHEMSHIRQDRDMQDWQFLPKLTTANIWDSFVLYTLLDDHSGRHSHLTVPHGGNQTDRFEAAMEERNLRIIHDGQPALDHACTKCTRVFQESDGQWRKVEVAVTDGITMGHPVCGDTSCSRALPNTRDKKKRFCSVHDDQHNLCAIIGCTVAVTPGSMTCVNEQHSEMERLHVKRGTSIFRLRQLNARAKGLEIHADGSEVDVDESEWFEVAESGEVCVFHGIPEGATGQADEVSAACSGKSETGNKKIRALFTRRRSHNEQLIVRPCGCIVARATLNSSEGVRSVMVWRSFSSLSPFSSQVYCTFH